MLGGHVSIPMAQCPLLFNREDLLPSTGASKNIKGEIEGMTGSNQGRRHGLRVSDTVWTFRATVHPMSSETSVQTAHTHRLL